MKTVVLMPIRNELAMLQYNLPNILKWADHVIIADQHSTDGTRELYKKYPEIVVVDNNHKGHSNEVYWQLLDEARRFGDKNLIFYIDADEWVPADMMRNELSMTDYDPGTQFEMSWIHPWKAGDRYRVDGVYRTLGKRVGWVDNGEYLHERKYVINAHTSAIPKCDGPVIRLETPMLHLQFMAWERLQWKQAWYRCSEHIAHTISARRINNKYSQTMETKSVILEPMPRSWKESLDIIPQSSFTEGPIWQKEAVFKWIDEYGIGYFEPLEIWQLPELRELFKNTVGREPTPDTYPEWLRRVNDLKNRVKYRWRSLLGK